MLSRHWVRGPHNPQNKFMTILLIIFAIILMTGIIRVIIIPPNSLFDFFLEVFY